MPGVPPVEPALVLVEAASTIGYQERSAIVQGDSVRVRRDLSSSVHAVDCCKIVATRSSSSGRGLGQTPATLGVRHPPTAFEDDLSRGIVWRQDRARHQIKIGHDHDSVQGARPSAAPVAVANDRSVTQSRGSREHRDPRLGDHLADPGDSKCTCAP